MATRLIILSILVMSSCRAPRFKQPIVRCVYSVEFNVCACQQYNLNEVEPITDMVEVDISECDDLVGFRAIDWAEEITPKGREIRNYGQDSCE